MIVVYKVDRLTRSLADFAKLVELFDQYGVSFVSITQSFNTTSSMGRLTLNVLLSFAQFEREVIGERVRDKIAASKRKGLWVGGPVPLGYRCIDKKLEIVPEEAEVVRTIFTCYLERGLPEAAKPPDVRKALRQQRKVGRWSRNCTLASRFIVWVGGPVSKRGANDNQHAAVRAALWGCERNLHPDRLGRHSFGADFRRKR